MNQNNLLPATGPHLERILGKVVKTSFGKSTILTTVIAAFCLGIYWGAHMLPNHSLAQFRSDPLFGISVLKLLAAYLLVLLLLLFPARWIVQTRAIHQWQAAIRGCLLFISFSFGSGALFSNGYSLYWVLPQSAYINQQALFQGILDVPLHKQNPYLLHVQSPIRTTLPIYLPRDHSDKSLRISREFESLSAGSSYFVEVNGVWKSDLSMYPSTVELCKTIAVRSIGRFDPTELVVHTPSIKEWIQLKISLFHQEMAVWPETVLQRVLPPAQTAMLNGILYGSKSGIDSDLLDGIAVLDITHLLAASGAHLAALSLPLRFLLNRFRLRRGIRLGIMVSMVWIYAMLAGFRVSTCRAAIVVTLYEIRPQLNAFTSFYRFILTAGFICLLTNPYWLFQVSFQLSFAVTIGFSTASEPLRRILSNRLRFLKRSPILLHLISGLLIVEAMSAPLIAIYFHQLSLVSFFSNLFLPLVIEALVPLGLFFTIGCWIFPNVMQVVFAPLFLKGLGAVGRWVKVASMNPGLIHTVAVSSWQAVCYYMGIALLLILYSSHKQINSWMKNESYRFKRTVKLLFQIAAYAALALLVLTVTSSFLQVKGQEQQVEVWYVNSRKEMADIIRLPSDEFILIWSGKAIGMTGSNGSSALNDPIVNELRSRGVNRIDSLILTDAKSAGMEGAISIFKQFKVGRVYLPFSDSPSLTEEYLKAQLDQLKTPYQDLGQVQFIQLSNGALLKNYSTSGVHPPSKDISSFTMVLSCFHEAILFSNHLPNEILPSIHEEYSSIPAMCFQQDIFKNDLKELLELSPGLVVIPFHKQTLHQPASQVDSILTNPQPSETSPESSINRTAVAAGQVCHITINRSQISCQIEELGN